MNHTNFYNSHRTLSTLSNVELASYIGNSCVALHLACSAELDAGYRGDTEAVENFAGQARELARLHGDATVEALRRMDKARA